VKGGEDHRLLAPGTGGGTPSSRGDQARRQTAGRGMERNLLSPHDLAATLAR
jgi:hypothetical protein